MYIGYVFLACALAAAVIKGYCAKKTSGYTSDYRGAVFANFIRMLLCILVGFVIIAASGDIKSIVTDKFTLLLSLMSGIFTSIFVVTWLISVRSGAYMMVDSFLTIGIIVPITLSALIFRGSEIAPAQIIGFVIALVGILIMCSYNNSIKAKLNFKSLFVLIICCISSGFSDFSQKCFMEYQKHALLSGNDIPVSVFNFYTYVVSALFLGIIFFATAKKSTKSERKTSYPPIMFLYILIMAICLFANSYFKTLAAGELKPIYLYPLHQGGSLTLSTIMISVFFKERITFKSILGTVIAFAGLLLINLF